LLTYEGDSLAYFDSQSVASGDYNGRLLAWINQALGTSYTEINGAKTALANAGSAPTWDGLSLLGSSRGPLGSTQIVAFGTANPNVVSTASTDAGRCRMTRTVHKTGGRPLAELQLAHCAYYVDVPGSPTGPTAGTEITTSSYTVEASIEMPGAPTPGPIRVTYSASNVGTCPAASGLYLSDAVPASSFGLSVIPADTTFYVKLHMVVALSATWSVNNVLTLLSANGEDGWIGPSASTSQVMTSGIFSAVPSGFASTVRPPLIAVLGKPYGKMRSLIIMQTSIAEYQNDTLGNGPTSGGFAARAAYSVNGHAMPWSKLARGGSGYQTLAAGGTKRAALYPYADTFLMDGPTNDVFYSRTAAQIETDLQTICARIVAARADAKIVLANIIPRTTSTDSWATEANQTPRTGFELNGIADTVNTWLPTQVGSNGVVSVVDVRASCRGVDPNKWAVTGYTSDGTHPSATAIAGMAISVNSALAAL
jgi:hypothetical protein